MQFERDGAAGNFTDALFPLSEAIVDVPGQSIYVIDWGIFDTVMLFHWGHLNMHPINDLFMSDAPSPAEEEIISETLSDTQGIFVGHVRSREAFSGVLERLTRGAAVRGYRKDMIRVIPDSNGREVFEIFRFLPAN